VAMLLKIILKLQNFCEEKKDQEEDDNEDKDDDETVRPSESIK